jgi:membrane protein
MNRRQLVNLFVASFKGWLANNAPIRAAALTYFIILPLLSLLLVVVTIFSLFFGHNVATHQLNMLITSFAGPVVANLFQQLLASAQSPFTSVWAAITVVGFSLAGGIGAFTILRDSMNSLWEVKLSKTLKFSARVRSAIGPFLLVFFLGLTVILGTVTSEALFDVIKYYSINGTLTLITLTITQILLSFGLSTILFAIIYKVLPDITVHWEDVIFPALLAGVAFTVVNYILGWYIQTFRVSTIAGAAGSLLIILLWIYILNMILLFGAEISKVYATTIGPHPQIHTPLQAGKFLKPLEEFEEEIEKATKGPIEEAKPEKTETAPLIEVPEHASASPSNKEKPATNDGQVKSVQDEEPKDEEPETGSVKVSVVIKTGRKKRKSDEQPD